MALIICNNCHRKLEHHAKGLCLTCYKKSVWKSKLFKCKRCERMLPMKAKGLCSRCYTSVFHSEAIKLANIIHWYHIDFEKYKNLTKKCILCDFDNIVELHHIDRNKNNISENNLVGLCPNHHRMIHHRKFQDEILLLLKENGYSAKPFFKPDSDFK